LHRTSVLKKSALAGRQFEEIDAFPVIRDLADACDQVIQALSHAYNLKIVRMKVNENESEAL